MRVGTLDKENEKLLEELEQLKRPKADSQNSSQSASRDQNTNAPSERQNRKHRPSFRHNRFVRKLIDNLDRVIRVDTNQHTLPEGLESDRYVGPLLEASIFFFKHLNQFSYECTVHALRELCMVWRSAKEALR